MIRNLCPSKLCNGTHLRVTGLIKLKYSIEAIINTGSVRNESVLIPYIPRIPSNYQF